MGDAGGVRSTLADAGFGFWGASTNIFEYDLTQANLGKPIAVNGQGGTWNVAEQLLSVTYDTGRLGLQGGQLLVSGFLVDDSLQKLNIPDLNRVSDITYNQQLAGGKINLQVGYSSGADYFVGTAVGGSLAAGVLGPQANIPYEVGLSFPPSPRRSPGSKPTSAADSPTGRGCSAAFRQAADRSKRRSILGLA